MAQAAKQLVKTAASSAREQPVASLAQAKQQQQRANGNLRASAREPVALFQGYDAVAGQGLSIAVEGESQSVGGKSFVKCDICTSTRSLSESLQVDQSLSVSYAVVGSISEKLQLINKLNLTTNCISIVVFARHTAGRETVTNVRGLKSGVKAPTDGDTQQLREFVQVYGDSFLSSRTTGGEYYAVYCYYCESREAQQDLDAQIAGAGIFGGVSVDASLQVKISRLNSAQKCRISFEQGMSGIENPEFPSSDRITDFALKFPSMPLTAPEIIQWTTTGYERVPGLGSKFDVVARNRNLLTSSETSAALSKLKELQGDINAIKTVYRLYGGYDSDSKLNSVKAQADADESKVRAMVSSYTDNPTQPLAAPAPLVLPSIANGVPSLQYVVKVLGDNDGHGNTPFDDVDLTTYVQQHRRISCIQMRSSPRLVSCLIVTYADDKGSTTVQHGTQDHDPGSQLSPQLVVRPGRSITTVSGYNGDVPSMAPAKVVTRLQVALDSGESICGGPASGSQPFNWNLPAGSFLLGFRGRQGWYIDVLQLVYAVFLPAKWLPHYNYTNPRRLTKA